MRALLAGVLTGLLACATATASAHGYDGVYRFPGTQGCTFLGIDNGVIQIRRGVLSGTENDCRMTNPVEVRDMDATLYDLQCQGEGMGWQERAMIIRSGNGVVIARRGYAQEFERCG